MVRQALKDLRSHNGTALEAASWLYSADGLLFLDALNLDPGRLPMVIDAVLDGAPLGLNNYAAGEW